MLLDGSDEADRRLRSMLHFDVNNGIARRSWARNDGAVAAVQRAMDQEPKLRVTILISLTTNYWTTSFTLVSIRLASPFPNCLDGRSSDIFRRRRNTFAPLHLTLPIGTWYLVWLREACFAFRTPGSLVRASYFVHLSVDSSGGSVAFPSTAMPSTIWWSRCRPSHAAPKNSFSP